MLEDEGKNNIVNFDYSLIKNATRIVIKIGTNVLMTHNVKLTQDKTMESKEIDAYTYVIQSIISQIVQLQERGKQVVLISSGSIGLGAKELGLIPPIKDITLRQVCAATGQPVLMDIYRNIAREFNLNCAQVLITRNDFNSLNSHTAIQNCIHTLLERSVLPIVNENDSVSTEEIDDNFGDNDQLSAMIASKLGADLLIILTDVDAFFSKNPRKYKSAKRIPIIFDVKQYLQDKDANIEKKNAETGTNYGTGGMFTKLKAASITQQVGCTLCIGSAFEKDILIKITDGKDVGTIFPSQRTLIQSKRWILHAKEKGDITIHSDAINNFLLEGSVSIGNVLDIQGDFLSETVVRINKKYKCVVCIGSSQILHIKEISNTEKISISSILLRLCDYETIVELS